MDTNISELEEELALYRTEKEKIRTLIGQIGGSENARTDKMFNIIFTLLVVGLFAVDITRHTFHFQFPLSSHLSVSLGILLVSMKIIWMMHRQMKVDHFQFWILNSIEFRLNDLTKKLAALEENQDV